MYYAAVISEAAEYALANSADSAIKSQDSATKSPANPGASQPSLDSVLLYCLLY